MGKITIISDVHGRSYWRKAVKNIDEVPAVFLGDYLDPYPGEGISKAEALEGFRDILALKKAHPERVTLLLGNHDCEYLYGREVCDCRTDNANYDEIQSLFRENKELFQLAAQSVLRGKRYVFVHAGIHAEWMERHVPGWTIGNMVSKLNELHRQAMATENPEVTAFAQALAEADSERGGFSDFGSPIWADAERINAGYQLTDIIQVVGHTGISMGRPVITGNVLYTDCRQALTLSERGVLRTLDGKICRNLYRDPFNPERPEWEKWQLFDLDSFDRPFCRSCGSRNIHIRAGMMVDHWYCLDCGKDQVL